MFKRLSFFGLTPIALLPLAGLGIAAGLSFLAPSLAQADDITVSASVIDSTPSATPTQFVTLPIGDTASAAPVVDIQLTGLEPYSFVQIFAQSDPVLIASGFADKFGVFKTKASLPPNLEAGDHTVTASVQKKGETQAALQTLAKFVISTGGKVQATPKNSKPGSGSNHGQSGGQGSSAGGQTGGGTVTQSPAASPMPTTGASSIGGVLLVGGAVAESKPSWNIEGAPARIAVSLQNNYKSKYPVKVSVTVTNILGWQVARITNVNVGQIAQGKHLMLIAETKSGIGQWGFYSASIRVVPPASIDGITLNALNREVSFFVVPIWPTILIILLIVVEILRRLFSPRIRLMRLAKLRAEMNLGTEERAE